MSLFTKLSTARDLSMRMADRLDVSLEDAFDIARPEGARALRAITLRCAGCTEHATCAQRLARAEPLDAAPDYCRNGDILEQLQRR